MALDDRGKSLANVFEAIILGIFVAFLFALEGALSKSKNTYMPHLPKLALVLNCSMVFILWALMPVLEE